MTKIVTALKGYFKQDVFLFLLLGLSCAIPLNLVGSTLVFRAREAGLDLKTIGLFAFVLLPYSLKFLWAPLIDCIRIPFLSKIGQKKAWGLVFQTLLIVCIAVLSFISPEKNTFLLFIFCLITSFCAASQDIVIDALRIDTLDGDKLKEGSSLYQLGYRIGMLITGAGIIAASSVVPWRICYLFSVLLILIGFISLIYIKEPSIQNHFPEKRHFNPFSSFLNAAKSFIQEHHNWKKILLFIVLYKMCNAILGRMAYPFYYDIGFQKNEIALVSSFLGTFVTMFGVFLGGLLMVKIGYFKSLMHLGFIEILTSFSFALLSALGHDMNVFMIVILFDNIIGGMGGAVFVAFLSSLCSKRYSATQYALLTSLTMFSSSSLAAASGWMVEQLGWMNFFMITGYIMLPALFLLRTIMKEAK